jgi:hypothetical protein
MRTKPHLLTALTATLTAFAAAVLLLGTLATPANAADALLPASASTLLRSTPSSIEGLSDPTGRAATKWRRQWAISLAPLVASQSLDAASSYGMRELNPLLASPDGGFGMKATGVKFGVAGALVGVEYFLVRKYPRSAKFFTIVNWTTAGATTGLAVHNFRLPRD